MLLVVQAGLTSVSPLQARQQDRHTPCQCRAFNVARINERCNALKFEIEIASTNCAFHIAGA